MNYFHQLCRHFCVSKKNHKYVLYMRRTIWETNLCVFRAFLRGMENSENRPCRGYNINNNTHTHNNTDYCIFQSNIFLESNTTNEAIDQSESSMEFFSQPAHQEKLRLDTFVMSEVCKYTESNMKQYRKFVYYFL
jgi:hypothetical protein